MKISNKVKKLIILSCFIIAFFFIMILFNNLNVLFHIASTTDEPSHLYYSLMKKIYKKSSNENSVKKILALLEDGKNEYLHDLYIRTIGVVGANGNYANDIIRKVYIKYQDRLDRKSIIFDVINTMGFIGNVNTVTLLERFLNNYDKYRMVVPKYLIARSLYFCTGEIYIYYNKLGEETSIYVTDQLKMIREIIKNSKGRYRTIEEMLIIDNLNRPDAYKY